MLNCGCSFSNHRAQPNPTPPTDAESCLRAFDCDDDGDVDLHDFATLGKVFTGPQ
ncbi:MAG: hypothetical protein KAV82_11430 [Phycisphaerae bacterium]|nr:hypothetical protein [Phycisphaerae bacterium]